MSIPGVKVSPDRAEVPPHTTPRATSLPTGVPGSARELRGAGGHGADLRR